MKSVVFWVRLDQEKKFLLTLLKYRINQLKFGTAPISDAGQDESSGRALGPSASAGADWIPSACRNLLDELKMADTAIFLPCGFIFLPPSEAKHIDYEIYCIKIELFARSVHRGIARLVQR